jgi:ureidoglycolate dehydrogenase (NAD+)
MGDTPILVGNKELESFAANAFMAAGLDEEQAQRIAQHLVLANLRGVDSHGVHRLPIYIERIERGLMSKTLHLTVEWESPISAKIDAGHSPGIVVAKKGMELAVKKAKENGIGLVAIRNSTHCGMLADYTLYGADQDCIAYACTNAPALIAPTGGKMRFFGNNPFTYGIHCDKEDNVIFDAAMSVAARGKIIVACKNGQTIPLGWAANRDGVDTTDPKEALDGLLLPIAGAKGYGIIFFIEVLTAILPGGNFGPYVGDLYNDFNRKQHVGHFLCALRPDLFGPMAEFKRRMDLFIREVRNVPLADGVEKIYMPGELERERTRERLKNGIPLSVEIARELIDTANKLKIKHPFK